MKIGDKHGYMEVLELVEIPQGIRVRARCNKCGREIWLSKTKFLESVMCRTCRVNKFGGEDAYEQIRQRQRKERHLCWICIHATNKYGKCPWSAEGIPRNDWETKKRPQGKFYVAKCKGYINDKYKEEYERKIANEQGVAKRKINKGTRKTLDVRR